jgi:hypothetical protein
MNTVLKIEWPALFPACTWHELNWHPDQRYWCGRAGVVVPEPYQAPDPDAQLLARTGGKWIARRFYELGPLEHPTGHDYESGGGTAWGHNLTRVWSLNRHAEVAA